MIRIGIYGICGKMGKRIACLAMKEKDFKIVAGVEKKNHPDTGKTVGVKVSPDIGEMTGEDIDCMIDFTSSDAVLRHVRECFDKDISMVIGTTGIAPDAEKTIAEASKKISIVFSPNMAVGVNVLFNLAKESAAVLGQDFSIKVDETHHVHKKDSPSGTAKMIGRIIKEASGKDVPIEASREGEVIGNHGIVFDGKFETLEIRHNAKSRDVFAAGALKAVRFVTEKKSGLYTMADVLGL